MGKKLTLAGLEERLAVAERRLQAIDGTQNAFVRDTIKRVVDIEYALKSTVKRERIVVFTTARFYPREFRVPESSFRPGPMHTVIRYEEA